MGLGRYYSTQMLYIKGDDREEREMLNGHTGTHTHSYTYIKNGKKGGERLQNDRGVRSDTQNKDKPPTETKLREKTG